MYSHPLSNKGCPLGAELLGSGLVPSALHQDIQHSPFLIDGTPEIVDLAIELEKHFIEVPLVSWTGTTPPKLIAIGLPEPQTPLSYGFVRYHHTTLSEYLLNVTVAQGKAVLEPDRVTDDYYWVAESFVRRDSGSIHLSSIAEILLLFATRSST